MTIKNLIRLLCSGCVGLAFVQSVVSVLRECGRCQSAGVGSYLFWVGLITILIFVANGFLMEGFLVRKAIIRIESIGMEICIGCGDIFKKPGVVVIGVNDFFDSLVDQIHINKESMHGQLVVNYWSGNTIDLDAQIESSLQGISYDCVRRDGVAKEHRYEIGTAAFVAACDGRRFILTALSETDARTNRTQSDLEKLSKAVKGALSVARECANGDRVSFYLMGGGNARIKASAQMRLTTILSAVISECLEHDKVSNQVDIVLGNTSPLRFMNLYDFGKVWSI